ncbi:XRE family transcriptional regulator [Opitutaceae bacterium TAV4]|uniref:helix-turn-helix domain-containing protein n=1 Tax=Geminisphaera colitermitum TaxID=1148786 RepID=UPI0009DDB6EC|nr:helix-turn-helix transcriptional regulator [Geminisphaera colitermitum]RRJ97187.1 XRE family transcriptional regulator [Opitutaceae bacterium TAV4]RRK01080.1 XRE family transcriptional regulator [Opitutaceae bacterium TAV3]
MRHPYLPRKEKNAIGPIVREVRKAREWSQEDLALRCQLRYWDMDRVMLAKIETGLRAISDWELLLLCNVLGITPDEILGVRPLPLQRDGLAKYLEQNSRQHFRTS